LISKSFCFDSFQEKIVVLVHFAIIKSTYLKFDV
jgi:hypothetical protein